MEFHYTSEKNHQILIALLKKKGIRYIIASPGATNVSFLSSVQSDPFFKIFSSVDERSAAYIACGMAAERQEPVVLSCTGATASRNYYPGMTEAFYRKLPIIAVTSTQISSRIGQHVPQVLDRRQIANDVALYSTTLPIVKDQEDFASCEAKVNEALIALTRKGGGPIHMNIETSYSRNYGVKELPTVREIHYPRLPLLRLESLLVHMSLWIRLSLSLLSFSVKSIMPLYFAITLADTMESIK